MKTEYYSLGKFQRRSMQYKVLIGAPICRRPVVISYLPFCLFIRPSDFLCSEHNYFFCLGQGWAQSTYHKMHVDIQGMCLEILNNFFLDKRSRLELLFHIMFSGAYFLSFWTRIGRRPILAMYISRQCVVTSLYQHTKLYIIYLRQSRKVLKN